MLKYSNNKKRFAEFLLSDLLVLMNCNRVTDFFVETRAEENQKTKQRMAALPLFKMGLLAVRTVSKPMANRLKTFVSIYLRDEFSPKVFADRLVRFAGC